MSDSEIDFEDEANETGEDANGPKALRDQVKKLNKQLQDLVKERDELKAVKRQGDLAGHLKKFDAPERLSKYAARDIEDVSEDSVLEWLKENGADFGWEQPTDEGSDEAAVQEAARRISHSSSAAPQSKTVTADALLNELKTADSKTLREKGLI